MSPSRPASLIQHAIDEASRILVAVALASSIASSIVTRAGISFIHDSSYSADPQNIMIDAREPSDRPMLKRAGHVLVERSALTLHALDQFDRELARAVIGLEAFEEQREFFARARRREYLSGTAP